MDSGLSSCASSSVEHVAVLELTNFHEPFSLNSYFFSEYTGSQLRPVADTEGMAPVMVHVYEPSAFFLLAFEAFTRPYSFRPFMQEVSIFVHFSFDNT